MRIFITGGTGFLGKRVVARLLEDGHTLLLLARDPARVLIPRALKKKVIVVKGDLADIKKHEAQIRRFRPEVAMHLAWEGIPSDAADFDIRNLENGLRVMRTCAAVGVKAVVMAGSCHEYGEPGVRVNESSPLRPFNALYATKVALYWIGSKFAAEHGMSIVWLRPGFIYGPAQRSKALIPYLVGTLKSGAELTLRTPNGGNDFVYVDDVADAFVKAAKRYKKVGTSVYNIGSGRLTSVAEVARNVYRELGMPVPKNFKKNPRKIDGFCMDNAKAKKELGWVPRTSLRDGIRKAVAYFQ